MREFHLCCRFQIHCDISPTPDTEASLPLQEISLRLSSVPFALGIPLYAAIGITVPLRVSSPSKISPGRACVPFSQSTSRLGTLGISQAALRPSRARKTFYGNSLLKEWSLETFLFILRASSDHSAVPPRCTLLPTD